MQHFSHNPFQPHKRSLKPSGNQEHICEVPRSTLSRCHGQTFFTESHSGVLLQQGLTEPGSNRRCNTSPQHPGGPSSATCHHDRVPLAAVPERPPGLGGPHQPPDPPGALRLLHLPGCVLLLWPRWCGCEGHCLIFCSAVSWGERIRWETDEAAEPTRWLNPKLFRIPRN